MAKRALCLLLACLTVLSAWVPAFAEEKPGDVPEITEELTDAPEPTAEPTATPEAVEEPTATPEPTAEPTATPEPTAEPTATPEATAEPTDVPEPTVEPTATPEAIEEPTATPEPTAEPTATPEPAAEPTATPEPTAEPTATPEPTAEPTATPEPTAEPTAAPEPTAEPTATPEPTAEPTATPEPTAEPTATPEPTAEPTAAPEPTAEPEAEEDAPEPELASEDEPEPLPVPKYAVENWQKVTVHYGFTSSGNYNTTDDGVRVTWEPVEGAASYKVWRKDGGGSWQLQTTCEAGTTSWFDEYVSSGSYYTYSVQSVDAGGNDGVFDGTGTGIRHWEAPFVTLSASNTAKGVKLTWGAVSGAVKYRVYGRSKDSDPWKMLKETADQSWLWTSPAVGVNYSYALQYVDKDGYASVFNECGDREWVYMAQPKVTSVKRGSGGITVKWKAVSGASSYDVFYRRADSDSWTQIRPNRFSQYYTTRDTSYTWSYSVYDGPDAGTVYYFIVRANESAAYSIISSQSVYEGKGTLSPITGAPKLTSVKNVKNNIEIKWNAVSGASKYRVFYKTGKGSWKKLADVSGTSYTWKKAISGKTYSFTVRAMTADKKYASAYNKTGKSITHTDMPKISKAVWSGKNVKLSWKSVKGAAKYRIYYRIGDGKWKKLTDTKKTSYTWKKAKSNTVYSFTVRCVTGDGKKTVSDFDDAGKLLAAKTGPKLSSAKNTDTGVTVKWKKMSGAVKYQVLYKTGGGKWKKLADTTETSYTWTEAKSGKKYSFTVRCVTADGKKNTSAYDKTGKSVTYVAAPKASASAATDGITISWGKVSGAAKYRVFYKTGSGSWKKLADTSKTSYTWKKAVSGTKYTFTVRCMNAKGSYVSAYDKTGVSATYWASGSGGSSGSGGGSSSGGSSSGGGSGGHWEWQTVEKDCPSCSGGRCSICGGSGVYHFAGQSVPCSRYCSSCDGKGTITQREYVYVMG